MLCAVVLVAEFKALDLLLGFIFRDAVGLLNLACQFDALAGNDIEMILGELAPLRFHFAPELLPVAFNDIPVHFNSSCSYLDGEIANRTSFVTAATVAPCASCSGRLNR